MNLLHTYGAAASSRRETDVPHQEFRYPKIMFYVLPSPERASDDFRQHFFRVPIPATICHSSEALLIDPVIKKADRYLQLMDELDLHLVKVADPHLYSGHITGLGMSNALPTIIRATTTRNRNTLTPTTVASGVRFSHRRPSRWSANVDESRRMPPRLIGAPRLGNTSVRICHQWRALCPRATGRCEAEMAVTSEISDTSHRSSRPLTIRVPPVQVFGGFGRWMGTLTTCTRQNAPGSRTGCQDCTVLQPGS
jgi:hypothetical protein